MTAKIKLNAASGGGSFSLQAPSSSANNRVFTLPDVADATMATVNGITMAQQWRQTTGVEPSAGATTTLQNWEANDGPSGYGSIGSSMSESSGVFTFPSTGIYLVKYNLVVQSANGAKRLTQSMISVTANNSSFDNASTARASMYGTDAFSSCYTEFIFDVTDVSTHKCKFLMYTQDAQTFTQAASDKWRTGVTFIKLGET